MKFAILTIAYHEERFIRPFLKHYTPLVDKILVLNSTVPWNGPLENYDPTADFSKSLGALTMKHHWPNEHTQRNSGLSVLSDFDWVFILDPDEFFEKSEFEKLKDFLSTASGNAYSAHTKLYWKKGYAIEPPETHCPVVAVRPTRVTFEDKRGIDQALTLTPFSLHHFSWARTDEEVFRKVTHFGHAGEFNGVEWYENVWKKWTPEMRNLHPMDSSKWLKAIETSIPDELKHLWEGL